MAEAEPTVTIPVSLAQAMVQYIARGPEDTAADPGLGARIALALVRFPPNEKPKHTETLVKKAAKKRKG